MTDEILGKFQLVELVAVIWNDELAARFPDMGHTFCRCEHDPRDGRMVRCMGWHCNRCGAPTNSYGHHDCPDRPEVSA